VIASLQGPLGVNDHTLTSLLGVLPAQLSYLKHDLRRPSAMTLQGILAELSSQLSR